MGDKELASGTSSAGHMLASLWLEPLVSQGSQEVFLVNVLRDSHQKLIDFHISSPTVSPKGISKGKLKKMTENAKCMKSRLV